MRIRTLPRDKAGPVAVLTLVLGGGLMVAVTFFWLGYAAAFWPSPEHVDYPADAQHRASDPQNESGNTPIQSAFSELKNSVAQPDRGCEPGVDDRSSDLCAQWKAADASKEGAYWTKRGFELGVVVAGVTTLGLFAAFAAALYARKAAHQARRGADAAEGASQDAARAYAVDRTAYLTLVPIDAEGFRFDFDQPLPATRCEIVNSGRGPAIVRKIHREWQSCSPEKPPTTIAESAEGKSFSIPVGPQGKSPGIYSHSQEKGFLARKGDWVYFLGFVEYEDATEKRFRSGFCYVARRDRADLGLHVAFVKDAEKYWYHK